MDVDQRRLFLGTLTVILQCPPDEITFIKQLIMILLVILKPPPDPPCTLHQRVMGNTLNCWAGRNVFEIFSRSRYGFFETTGETPETMLDILRDVGAQFHQRCGRPHKLSPLNKVMLFVLWLRSYPSYHFLSTLFDVSVSTVMNEMTVSLAIFKEKYTPLIRWPTLEEWGSLEGAWHKLPSALGAIDGTSTEIYRPQTDPQEHYFSGHRHFHCIHTQVVINNQCNIVLLESGFLGHQNDAQQFRLMRQIGTDENLPFPLNKYILGDKIYPNRYPVVTPYTRQQITRKPEHLKRKCRKLNRLITEYRVSVEHVIGELKCYKVMGTLWRHPRHKLKAIVEVCGSFVNRRKQLFN